MTDVSEVRIAASVRRPLAVLCGSPSVNPSGELFLASAQAQQYVSRRTRVCRRDGGGFAELA